MKTTSTITRELWEEYSKDCMNRYDLPKEIITVSAVSFFAGAFMLFDYMVRKAQTGEPNPLYQIAEELNNHHEIVSEILEKISSAQSSKS